MNGDDADQRRRRQRTVHGVLSMTIVFKNARNKNRSTETDHKNDTKSKKFKRNVNDYSLAVGPLLSSQRAGWCRTVHRDIPAARDLHDSNNSINTTPLARIIF